MVDMNANTALTPRTYLTDPKALVLRMVNNLRNKYGFVAFYAVCHRKMLEHFEHYLTAKEGYKRPDQESERLFVFRMVPFFIGPKMPEGEIRFFRFDGDGSELSGKIHSASV